MSDADDDDLLKFLQGEMPGGIPPQDIHMVSRSVLTVVVFVFKGT